MGTIFEFTLNSLEAWQWAMLITLTIAVGALAGFLGAFTGLGGGMIVRPVMGNVFNWSNISGSLHAASKTIAIVSNSNIITNALTAVPEYSKSREHIIRKDVLLYLVIGLAVGMFVGNNLEGFIIKASVEAEGILNISYALFLVFVVFVVIYKNKIKHPKWISKTLVNLILGGILVGFLMGLISGLFGVGGGAIKIPFIIIFFGATLKQAAMYSLILALISSPVKMFTSSMYLADITNYWGNGVQPYISELSLGWILGGTIVFTSILGAYYGAKVQMKVKEKAVQIGLVSVLSWFSVTGIIWASLDLANLSIAPNSILLM